MNIKQLEFNLQKAQQHLRDVTERFKQRLEPLDQLFVAREEVCQAERDLAAAKGQEYATPLNLGFVPELAISGPILLQDDYNAFLAFNAMRPTSEGTRVSAGLAIIELIWCNTTKFGYPNDEAFPGHPLYKFGLECGGVHEVHNSSWIDEEVRINRVRFPKTKRWKARHFIFAFHESTLECITRDIKAELPPYSSRFQKVYEAILTWSKIKHEIESEE